MSNHYYLDPNCLECQDQGWFDIPCERCGATGFSTMEDDSPLCEDCDGTGLFEVNCQACNEKGVRRGEHPDPA